MRFLRKPGHENATFHTNGKLMKTENFESANSENEYSLEEKIDRYLPTRQFLTAKELVHSGIFGSMTAVRHAIKKNKLETLWTSERRCIIVRDSLIDHILTKTREKAS